MLRTFSMLASLLVIVAGQELYDTSQHTLGNNLIINPQFREPPFPNDTVLFLYYYSTNLPGWNCSRQCEVKNFTNICRQLNKNCSKINVDRVVDLHSHCVFDNVSQTVTI